MTIRTAPRRVLIALMSIGLLGALAGCREEEQDRMLMFDKGTYLGQPDSELSDADRSALQHRARHQGAL